MLESLSVFSEKAVLPWYCTLGGVIILITPPSIIVLKNSPYRSSFLHRQRRYNGGKEGKKLPSYLIRRSKAMCIILAANCAQAFLHSGGDPGLKSCVRGPYHTLHGGGQTEAAAAIHGM